MSNEMLWLYAIFCTTSTCILSVLLKDKIVLGFKASRLTGIDLINLKKETDVVTLSLARLLFWMMITISISLIGLWAGILLRTFMI